MHTLERRGRDPTQPRLPLGGVAERQCNRVRFGCSGAKPTGRGFEPLPLRAKGYRHSRTAPTRVSSERAPAPSTRGADRLRIPDPSLPAEMACGSGAPVSDRHRPRSGRNSRHHFATRRRRQRERRGDGGASAPAHPAGHEHGVDGPERRPPSAPRPGAANGELTLTDPANAGS